MKILLKIYFCAVFVLMLVSIEAVAREVIFKSDSINSNFQKELCECVEIPPKFNKDTLLKVLVYPDIFKRSFIEGTAFVAALVDTNGIPVQMKIVKSLHVTCDEASLKTVSKLRFTPAMYRGQKIECWVIVPVEYKLR